MPPRHSSDEPGRHLPYARLTGLIIGVFYDVYNELGYGFSEPVYRSAVAIVLAERGFRIDREVKLDIHFHGQHIGSYRADLIVENRVILELKAGAVRPPGARSQLINYLRVAGREVGLLLFFGPAPEFWRVVASGPSNDEE